MRPRYLAAICRSGAAAAVRERLERLLPASLKLLFDHRGVLVFGDRPAACLFDPAGAIIGSLFARGTRAAAQSLSKNAWSAIEHSRGTELIEAYWGSYVAILIASECTTLLRAPLGDLGCYYHCSKDRLLVASDVALLATAGQLRRRIDEGALARHIANPDWRSNETCLRDILELRGGNGLQLASGRVEQIPLWSPWRFAHADMQIEDAEDAVSRVGDAVRLAVTARTAGRRCLLLLSGGLDSSVVAATLARAGTAFTCLNLVANDTASDESHYAQLVADRCGVTCEMRRFELASVDIGRSAAAEMPYPAHRCFTQALDEIASLVAVRTGAELIVDGGGGDNLFFASRTVSIVADCLLASGFDARFWNAARSLGDLAQTSVVTVARKAAARAWFRGHTARPASSTAFLSESARAAVARGCIHPWLVPPPDVLPGRASHVALLAPAQNLVEALNAQASYCSVSPLVSQPVAETCLRVPSWHWLAPGMNRAAVRRAFETELPEAIVRRRSKGAPTAFVAELFERNRLAIRELLLGGVLAETGILNRTALATALSRPGPTRDLNFVRVMELVDAEAWARAQI